MHDSYIPPKLIKYGKIEDIVQAGSVPLESGDLTGDNQAETAFDTNNDGRADFVVRSDSGENIPVTFAFNRTSREGVNADFYDSDGDSLADFAIAEGSLQRIAREAKNFSDYLVLADSGRFYSPSIANSSETSSDGGWNESANGVSGDLTGDNQAETAFDTNNDGRADFVVGGASGANTPVTFQFNRTSRYGVNADFYDSDGDSLADFASAQGSLQRINSTGTFGDYVVLSDSGKFYSRYISADSPYTASLTETSAEGGWDDPNRD